MQTSTWPPTAAQQPSSPPSDAADGDRAWRERQAAQTPLPPAAVSDASRAQTPAPVKAADAEVAARMARRDELSGASPGAVRLASPLGFRARTNPDEHARRAADELPASPGVAQRAGSPLGFRVPPPGFSPAAAAPLELGATSFDEDSETEAVFRRARDALLLQRARATPSAPALDERDEELSEWSTDDGGVTWVKSARAQRRVAALAGRKAGRATPSAQQRAVVGSRRPLSPVREPASPTRDALRMVLLPLAVYFIVVGVWHHVRPLLPEHVLERLL